MLTYVKVMLEYIIERAVFYLLDIDLSPLKKDHLSQN